MNTKRDRVTYTVRDPKIPGPLTLAVIPDLHSGDYENVIPDLRAADAILVPGDLVNRHRKSYDGAVRFLREAPKMAPVFYSTGNHERKCHFHSDWMQLVRESEVVLLEDRSLLFEGIRIGGLSDRRHGEADRRFLRELEGAEEYTLLMCHRPEVWRDQVRGRDIDLTLCGHAHGGQVQIFGQGLYAPGQGFFPKLTHGIYGGGRMILSRGMTNGARAPRINNPCELIVLKMEPAGDGKPAGVACTGRERIR